MHGQELSVRSCAASKQAEKNEEQVNAQTPAAWCVVQDLSSA